MSPWGYPTPTGVVPYFDAEDAATIAGVHDSNVFLVNGTGWITYGDTFPECVPLEWWPLENRLPPDRLPAQVGSQGRLREAHLAA
jgi:hypothetical protein